MSAADRLLRSGPPGTEAVVDEYRDRALPLVEQLTGKGFRDQWEALAGLGVLRLDPPEPGPGASADDAAPGPVTRSLAMIEGIGLAGADPGVVYAMASQVFGMEYPLRAVLPAGAWRSVARIQDGRELLCHALTERKGGSDPLSMDTRATRDGDGDGYVLEGAKTFITAAPVADLALVFARTEQGRSPFSLSAFLFPVATPGVTRADAFAKTALPGVPMGELVFDGVRLGAGALVGGEGSGLAILSSTTTWERALLLGYALGPMRRTLQRLTDWASGRGHFGRRMGSSHQVAARVSDMALVLHRSRTLLYSMAARLDAGTPTRRLSAEAALTKISVSEDYVRLTEHATALSGVRAFIADSELPADLHSPMAALTYAGPNDLLRIGVAREFGLPVEN
ncbi:acyl-CoA dehydrogenase family protein [Streptomyces telluris]|uniref:Acyl-CoA dehydrogenase n=1 Tax=Streptomyces telluris TaxID=2720021 RepID=A0A9X2RS26_9ACTN|nr:acyl-CoA dehydrogenase [Streptomyces telluris]MCQ8774151.1 acyl-CoA dehydrogenase [Streptomyces telluris]